MLPARLPLDTKVRGTLSLARPAIEPQKRFNSANVKQITWRTLTILLLSRSRPHRSGA